MITTLWEHITAYEEVISIDIITFFSGLIGGVLIHVLRSTYLSTKVLVLPDKNKKVNFVRVKDHETKKELVYINPKNFKQSLEMNMYFEWWNLTGRKKNYHIPSERTQKIVYYTIIGILAVITICGFYAAFTVQRIPYKDVRDMYDFHKQGEHDKDYLYKNFNMYIDNEGRLIIEDKKDTQ